MTEKEKAKAYDEAIERAKKWHNIPNPIYCNIIIEKIFPELKESEDEKIRKEIISILRNAYWTSNKNRFNELVAWLEKQRKPKSYWKPTKEQYEALDYAYNNCPDTERGNYYEGVLETLIEDLYMLEKQGENSTNKIKPRFNVGDWVVFITSGSAYQVEKKENYEYTLRNIHGGLLCVSFSNEELIREWTIQDAIDGDILVHSSFMFGDFIFIYNSTSILQAYCYYSNERNRFIIEDRGHYCPWNMQEVTPATKEQRDLLFQKIKEAGYKWDAEKKELKED